MTAFLFLSVCFHAAAGLLEGSFESRGLVSCAGLGEATGELRACAFCSWAGTSVMALG